MTQTTGPELKKLSETKKLVLGTERNLKLLKRGSQLKKVIIAKNCNIRTVKLIERYSKISGIELEISTLTNEKLGTLCKKPFLVSVIGVAQ